VPQDYTVDGAAAPGPGGATRLAYRQGNARLPAEDSRPDRRWLIACVPPRRPATALEAAAGLLAIGRRCRAG
jgi:hypothetical protein